MWFNIVTRKKQLIIITNNWNAIWSAICTSQKQAVFLSCLVFLHKTKLTDWCLICCNSSTNLLCSTEGSQAQTHYGSWTTEKQKGWATSTTESFSTNISHTHWLNSRSKPKLGVRQPFSLLLAGLETFVTKQPFLHSTCIAHHIDHSLIKR